MQIILLYGVWWVSVLSTRKKIDRNDYCIIICMKIEADRVLSNTK